MNDNPESAVETAAEVGAEPWSVVSWNVLADAYVRPEWFPGSNPDLLAPGARTARIVQAITDLDADVVCLQEVDRGLKVALESSQRQHAVLWCPKYGGRPDGCLTLVRRGFEIRGRRRLDYDAGGGRTSGHVAHLLTIETPQGAVVTVANTHLRWAEASQPDHVGVRQAEQLVAALADAPTAVIAADLNDQPGGPVRAVLRRAGYRSAIDEATATSVFAGNQLRALDVVAARGLAVLGSRLPFAARAPRPDVECPSDHVPVMADLAAQPTSP